jgi:hypothetical protein
MELLELFVEALCDQFSLAFPPQSITNKYPGALVHLVVLRDFTACTIAISGSSHT